MLTVFQRQHELQCPRSGFLKMSCTPSASLCSRRSHAPPCRSGRGGAGSSSPARQRHALLTPPHWAQQGIRSATKFSVPQHMPRCMLFNCTKSRVALCSSNTRSAAEHCQVLALNVAKFFSYHVPFCVRKQLMRAVIQRVHTNLI